MPKDKTNKRYDKAKELHQKVEKILLECQEFGDSDQYALIIDSLTKVNLLFNELKIKAIKEGNVNK